VKDLLRTSDLNRDEILYLLDLASSLRKDPLAHRELLQGRIVVLYFAHPSTRTRISFEAAVAALGGVPAVVGPDELHLGRGETIEDTARIISRHAAAFVLRTSSDEEVATVAQNATIPVVNALTDGHHPMQCLADLLTIRDRLHHFADRKLAYVGDGNNVAHSLLEGAATVGMDISVATPPDYAPAGDVVRRAEELAEVSGSVVEVTADPHAAVKGADVVYTDVWLSMNHPLIERTERQQALAPYRVTRSLLADAGPDALFMHCLPAHRGDEVVAGVIDGPQSVVFEQAANRLPTAEAVLLALVDGRLGGGDHWC
jgi:ornithine carbamoyltransferase